MSLAAGLDPSTGETREARGEPGGVTRKITVEVEPELELEVGDGGRGDEGHEDVQLLFELEFELELELELVLGIVAFPMDSQLPSRLARQFLLLLRSPVFFRAFSWAKTTPEPFTVKTHSLNL
jgi:hypothetical protein